MIKNKLQKAYENMTGLSHTLSARKEYCEYLEDILLNRKKIICICGSTRFADLHAIKRWEFERTGEAICLMINYLPGWYAEKEFGKGKNDHFGEASGLKESLDELHFRKIDLSDEIFVVNHDGYIGESTQNEIEYAKKTGKPVKYMEPPAEKQAQQLTSPTPPFAKSE